MSLYASRSGVPPSLPLASHDLFYKEMNIPAAVRLRMGLVR